jgi:hypothetical protein
LAHGNIIIQPNETTLDIPPSKKIIVNRVLCDQIVNQLYVPKAKNYAAIDAWIPGIGAFQMTIGKKHGINDRAKGDLVMLGGGNRLYWVVLPEHYHSFTKKSPFTIEQHAIQIPYPE